MHANTVPTHRPRHGLFWRIFLVAHRLYNRLHARSPALDDLGLRSLAAIDQYRHNLAAGSRREAPAHGGIAHKLPFHDLEAGRAAAKNAPPLQRPCSMPRAISWRRLAAPSRRASRPQHGPRGRTSVFPLRGPALRATSEFSIPAVGPIPSPSRGWAMTAIRGNLKYLIAAAAGAAVFVLAMNGVTRLQAAPSHTTVAQSRSITHDGMVDRSRKGDRLDFVAPATRTGMPIGCDAPFSPLVKLSPSNVTGRCLT